MEWAENNDTDYIFGLAGNATLDAQVAEVATNLRFHHAMSSKPKLRTYASFTYQAGSWKRPRRSWPGSSARCGRQRTACARRSISATSLPRWGAHLIAAALQGQELGDGRVYKAIAEAQRRHFDPPILLASSKWDRRFISFTGPLLPPLDFGRARVIP